MSGNHNMYTSKLTRDSSPSIIQFSDINSEWIMKITPDRKIVVNENVEVNRAAQAVLDSLQELLNKSKPQYRELSDEEIDLLNYAVNSAICSLESEINHQEEVFKGYEHCSNLSGLREELNDVLKAKAILKKASEK